MSAVSHEKLAQAYIQGYTEKCAQLGLTPEGPEGEEEAERTLLQQILRGAGGGALGGGLTGMGIGAAQGLGGGVMLNSLTRQTPFGRRHLADPEYPLKAALINALLGGVGGASLGALAGGIGGGVTHQVQ